MLPERSLRLFMDAPCTSLFHCALSPALPSSLHPTPTPAPHYLLVDALSLIYISSYEGFGLPLAEAMTSGTLGIVANRSSLPEVGGPGGFFSDDPKRRHSRVDLDPDSDDEDGDGDGDDSKDSDSDPDSNDFDSDDGITTYVNDPTDAGEVAVAIERVCQLTGEERRARVRRARRWVERYGGGGVGGVGHGWDEMARLVAEHIRYGRKHRGLDCYRASWSRSPSSSEERSSGG